MKAIRIEKLGGPDDLVLCDLPQPVPGPGQVRIAVEAAGVNFPDLLIIAGKYQVRPDLPFTPGHEVAGTVLETGPGVSHVAPGDRVMATVQTGGYAEEALAEAQSVFRLPDGVSFEQAGGFPIAYGTSYHALVDRAGLKSGETLLVHGASGGVGLTAVELGKKLGATVIGTVGSDEKIDIVRRYGADHVINYSTENFRDRVLELTAGKGADVIYDPVGGDVFDLSRRCIAWAGRLLVIGFASGRIPELPVNHALVKGYSLVGVYWGAFAERDPDANRANFETLLNWCAEGSLDPHVSMRFPLAKAGEAMKTLRARKTTGKILVLPRLEG